MAADLRFWQAPGSTALEFGATDAPPAIISTATVQAQVTRRGLSIKLGRLHQAALAINITRSRLSAQARYDAATPRPEVCHLHARQQAARPAQLVVSAPSRQATQAPSGLLARQKQALAIAGHVAMIARRAAPLSSLIELHHQQARPLQAWASIEQQQALACRREIGDSHQQAQILRQALEVAAENALRYRRQILARQQQGAGIVRHAAVYIGGGIISGLWIVPAHQQAMRPLPGYYSRPDVPQPGPEPLRYPLVFCQPWPSSPDLIFGWTCPAPVEPPATRIIPIRSAYIVLNNVTLTRLPDGLPLPALSLSLSIDVDSWCWGWSATLPAQYLDELMPAPDHVEVLASVNGETFRLRVEKITRTRQFGQARIQIGSRGRAAELADPSAPDMSYGSPDGAMTAQQLAIAAITAPGLPPGWEIDWQLEDWLVPLGAWSHQGTPISAVQRIAEAAGAYVQADPSTQILHLLHRYPVKPWEWSAATPDVEIPVAVTVTEDIEWSDKPNYTRVYVSGQGGGILGQVTRAGTAGDVLAPMVTDPLITHPYAARQRGLAILADTGRKALQTLSLPVLEESGIILPGQIIRFTEPGQPHRVGLVRGASINYGRPKLRQTIQVETHGN